MEKINFIISYVETILEEGNASKQVKEKLNKILNILKSEEDLYIKKDKCIPELEELDSNGNIEAGIRVQLLDIASSLEGL